MKQAFDPAAVQDRLRRSWSAGSSSRFRPDNPALGQCSATALVVHQVFGGEVLKTLVPLEGRMAPHFYNRIGGRCFDFTAEQFAMPVRYDDAISSPEEALTDTSPAQVAQLLATFHAA
ncbi:hypothetical protein JMJ55_16875 [Belnapia sp. T6]|uniref:Uncharacterized protein n=1 Tax=Belnapia mucosa TaxID=2804532 RepID=A0ABS1V6Q8_9PROT|nr:hypothetical protein [Belnapia mucosa]MBL6457012.1 hypothetical protein [Belnapia mucosa]